MWLLLPAVLGRSPWRGQGRKKRWVSPWLMATYDSASGTFGSVCRVMSGLTDEFYKAFTRRALGGLAQCTCRSLCELCLVCHSAVRLRKHATLRAHPGV